MLVSAFREGVADGCEPPKRSAAEGRPGLC